MALYLILVLACSLILVTVLWAQQRAGGRRARRFGFPVATFVAEAPVCLGGAPPRLSMVEHEGRVTVTENYARSNPLERMNNRYGCGVVGSVSDCRRRIDFRTDLPTSIQWAVLGVCAVVFPLMVAESVLASGGTVGARDVVVGVGVTGGIVALLVSFVRRARERAAMYASALGFGRGGKARDAA